MTKKSAYERLTKGLEEAIRQWRTAAMETPEWAKLNVYVGDDLDFQMAFEAIALLKLQED